MISRADYEIDLFLVDICLLAFEPDLPAALVVFAVARNHGEGAIRCLVVERRAELGDVFRPQRGERSSHTGFAESDCKIGVAAGANRRIPVGIYRIRRRVRMPLRINQAPRRPDAATAVAVATRTLDNTSRS